MHTYTGMGEYCPILNEKGLLMTIDQNFTDKTVVMISHRNSTLGACRRVCHVKDGKAEKETGSGA